MKTFIAEVEHDEKETDNKWNGNFATPECYKQVIKCDETFRVVRPNKNILNDYEPIAIVVKKGFNEDEHDLIKDTLYSINETSNMRANASGPIDKQKLLDEKGWVENVDYKLRTPNSYYPKMKDGTWGDIAVGQDIHSLLLGYKRGRFTGKIQLSAWSRDNADRWEKLLKISETNERAFDKFYPERYYSQKTFAEKFIDKDHRMGIFTAYSPNKYNEAQTKQMSLHIDKGDTELGFTTMSVFRVGEYTGAYLVFPRWQIGIDTDDGDIVIANSKQVHGVSPIYGEGTRLSCVAYCDSKVATLAGGEIIARPEKLIGQTFKKEGVKPNDLEAFL